jgi:hypothetical protein
MPRHRRDNQARGRDWLSFESNQGDELILRIANAVLRRAVANGSDFVQLIRPSGDDEREMAITGRKDMLIDIGHFHNAGGRSRDRCGQELQQNCQ